MFPFAVVEGILVVPDEFEEVGDKDDVGVSRGKSVADEVATTAADFKDCTSELIMSRFS